MREAVATQIANLPTTPGVYLMKDAHGEVFYIGKAKSLRDRVRGYFSGTDERAFVALLDELLCDLEVVLTDTATEALILENDLIKRHQPRFNVKLTDDKNFLSLRLDTRVPYPRLEVVRRMRQDGARYFGPYTSAQSIRETLRVINRHFQLRTCSDAVMQSRSRPCLQYEIKRCPAPCVLDLTGGAYARNVEAVTAFLSGRERELVIVLRERMQRHAAALEFEAAGQVRDQLRAIERSLERQRLVSADAVNRDVIGLYREGPDVEVFVLRTRDGRLVEGRRYAFADLEQPTTDLLSDFAVRYLAAHRSDLPDELLLPPEMEWAQALEAYASDTLGHPLRVLTPRRGDKRHLVELAARNAQQALAAAERQKSAAANAIERLQRALHLRRAPETLECVDISHHQGSAIVASVVRFERGLPVKDGYRRYRIRSLEEQDDFRAIYEVVSRRARRGLEEGDLPALLVIDGGKGQLAAARAALDDHGIDSLDLVSLAKARTLSEKESHEQSPRGLERVFVVGHKTPIILRQDSAELFLLTRARDEAHRFAIAFHRQALRRTTRASRLDSIAGIGPVRRKALLRRFGSLTGIRDASDDELAAVVGPRVVAALRNALTKSPVQE
ncbi:MAG: excinuclease ABC subunit UvrC [Myxococcota bacterium]